MLRAHKVTHGGTRTSDQAHSIWMNGEVVKDRGPVDPDAKIHMVIEGTSSEDDEPYRFDFHFTNAEYAAQFLSGSPDHKEFELVIGEHKYQMCVSSRSEDILQHINYCFEFDKTWYKQ